MKTEEEIKGIIKSRYERFKEALEYEIKDLMDESIVVISGKEDYLKFRIIQETRITFTDKQIDITLLLSDAISNTDEFLKVF